MLRPLLQFTQRSCSQSRPIVSKINTLSISNNTSSSQNTTASNNKEGRLLPPGSTVNGGNLLLSSDSNSQALADHDIPHTQKTPNHCNVAIVGGGIIGTSVAYHLAKLGIQDVILLERDKLTSGTTWHAAGLINTFGSLSATSTAMRMYTKKLYSEILPEETSMDTGFYPVGFIELACDAHRLEYYRRVAAFNRLCGVKVDEITPKEVKDKFPLIETDDVLAGFYVADDGRVNPYDATMALARAAKMYGARIYEDVTVKGVVSSNYRGPSSTSGKTIKDAIPRVTGITLDNGEEIEANVVVNCAGMWARQFGEMCGVNIPNQAAEHYYLITDAIDKLDPSWPIIEDSSKCMYVRPEGAGLMLGLFERMGAPWNVEEIPNDFSFGEIEPDWNRMGPYLEKAMERVPITLNTGVKKFFCGPESFTPDGSPIIGEAPELKNYFVAAGLNSVGILTGGGIGKLLATLIKEQNPPSDLDVTGINVDRFHSYQCNQKYREQRVGETLGDTYKVHYPDHSPSTCRDVKRSPLHSQMMQQNAFFRDVSGWESPSWFAPKGVAPLIEEEHFGRQSFFPFWEREHNACRNNVVLFDMSFMSKFLVSGTDAGELLNKLSTANVDGESGRITYTQWLNHAGYMEADLTITKITDDEFLVVTTDTMHKHVLTHMRRQMTNQKHVFVNDVTNAYAQINVQGPNSRRLLQGITSHNLDNDKFPFRSAAEIDISHGRALVTRITYVGELGYELFVPVEVAHHVYEVIRKAGEYLGLEHAGLKALGSLRMEKGYRDYGHDMDNTDTLLETGLGFTCDFNKDDGFIGMDSVLRQKQRATELGGLSKRMVQVLLCDPEPLLHHGEVLWKDGARVSEIRSASYGHTIGGAVGLSMLESPGEPITGDFIRNHDWCVETPHGMVPCTVSVAPLYDAKNTKIKL